MGHEANDILLHQDTKDIRGSKKSKQIPLEEILINLDTAMYELKNISELK